MRSQNKNMLNKLFKKNLIFFIYIVIFITLLSFLNYANTYSNNSIEIEINPQRMSYDYGEDVSIDISILNKNRYGKLYYKITEIYTGSGFTPLNLSGSEKSIDELKSSSDVVTLRDKYYQKEKKGKSGRHAYEMTDKEYSEFTKYRSERIIGEKLGSKDLEHFEEKDIKQIRSKTNATVFIFVIILLVIVILIIFIWFIIKSRSGNGYHFKNIIIFIGISLLLNITNNKIYGADIYQENEKYNKTISIQVDYANFTCTFDIKFEYYFINTIAPIDDFELDTDDDTLPDFLEVLYLTDLNNNDTDGDGLFDGVEILRTHTDPLRVDTDNNGIADGNEDYDNDGLTNLEERANGTDYENIDTDFDNISDFDEVNGVKSKDGKKIYETNPLNEDTDGDGLKDGTEIKLGLNPTKDKTNTITIDSERKVSQTISQSVLPKELTIESPTPISFIGEVAMDIDENVSARISDNDYYGKIQGVIGNPIFVETNYGYNDGLKITFDLNNYKIIAKRIQLCRVEDGKVISINQTYLKDNILYADVFSGEYVLIDSKEYMKDKNIY